jgi:hypothetical protein
MLYSKQQANPRSPLTAIRNQIKSTQQSLSRSNSRSPSYSPVSRVQNVPLKDYNSYKPVRSSSKLENQNPRSVTSTHLELKSKRKSLVNATIKLEKKLMEIKKKIETEVKITRIGLRKTPRSTYVTFMNKLNTLFKKRINSNLIFSFGKMKECEKKLRKVDNLASSFYSSNIKSKYFNLLFKALRPEIDKRKVQVQVAKRHYRLQILLLTFSAWQEYSSLEKMNIEDRSYIEEMDSLLQSFIHDSLNMSNIN